MAASALDDGSSRAGVTRGTVFQAFLVSVPDAPCNRRNRRPRARIHSGLGSAGGHGRPEPGSTRVLLPIRPLFQQRGRAIAHLHPAGRLILAKPGLHHVSDVLALCNRAFAQSSALDCLQEGAFTAGLHSSPYQISHTGLFYRAISIAPVIPRLARTSCWPQLVLGIAM